jgi:hypothetical protein
MAGCDWAIVCDYAFLDIGRKMCMIGVPLRPVGDCYNFGSQQKPNPRDCGAY